MFIAITWLTEFVNKEKATTQQVEKCCNKKYIEMPEHYVVIDKFRSKESCCAYESK